MAVHRGQWRGRDDLRPPVKQFGYIDDMAEADEQALAEQRAEAYQKSLPPVRPDKELDSGGSRFLLYSGDGAREMRRREAEVKRIRAGGRK